jgi:hypothetical protein
VELKNEHSKTVLTKFVAVGGVSKKDGMRDDFFNLNGVAATAWSMVKIKDATEGVASTAKSKTNLAISASVSEPMLNVRLRVGEISRVGDSLLVLSAVKMETAVAGGGVRERQRQVAACEYWRQHAGRRLDRRDQRLGRQRVSVGLKPCSGGVLTAVFGKRQTRTWRNPELRLGQSCASIRFSHITDANVPLQTCRNRAFDSDVSDIHMIHTFSKLLFVRLHFSAFFFLPPIPDENN